MSDEKTTPAVRTLAVELHTLRTYRVKRGHIDLGVFQASEPWEGMISLTNDKGEKLVADSPEALRGGFFGAFGDIFGKSTAEVYVMRGSPELLAKLEPAPEVKP